MNFGDNLLDDSGVLEGEEAGSDSGTKESSMTTSISLSAIAGTVQGPKKWFATKEGPRQEQAIFRALYSFRA